MRCLLFGHRFGEMHHAVQESAYYLKTVTSAQCTTCGEHFTCSSEGHSQTTMAKAFAREEATSRLRRLERNLWQRFVG